MGRPISPVMVARLAKDFATTPVDGSSIADGTVADAKLSEEYAKKAELDAFSGEAASTFATKSELPVYSFVSEKYVWPDPAPVPPAVSLANEPVGGVIQVLHDGVLAASTEYSFAGNVVTFDDPQAEGVETEIFYTFKAR